MTEASIMLLGWAGSMLLILGIVLLLAHPTIQKKGWAFTNAWPSLIFASPRGGTNTVKSLAYICMAVGIFCLYIFFST